MSKEAARKEHDEVTAGLPAGPEASKELDRLRLEVWRMRRRKVRLMGRLFLAGGFAALVVGYFINYFGIELVAAVLIPGGVFFSLAGNEPYMKSSVAANSVISAMKVLQESLAEGTPQGKALLVPDAGGGVDVKMYMSGERGPDGLGTTSAGAPRAFTPLGHELFLAYLQEAGTPPLDDVPLIMDRLRTLMTTGLELVEDVRFDVSGSEVSVFIRNATFSEIGAHPDLAEGLFMRAGCPVTNSIAEWLAYCARSRVKWVTASVNPVDRSAFVKLAILPREDG